MVEERLKELVLSLPAVSKTYGSYVPGIKANGLLFTSGRIPTMDGKLVYSGKLGTDLSIDQGYEAAKLCALHCLAVVKQELGDLDRVRQVMRITGYVNSGPGFTDQPKVLNGASDVVVAILGDRGQHARSAVGVAELPNNAAVEVEMVVLYDTMEGV